MSLKEKIQGDLTVALKGEKELELSVLRMLYSAVNNKETEKKTKIWKEKPETSPEEIKKQAELSDEEIFEVIGSEIKKRRESIESFIKGKREELADKEKQEAVILQKYLPEQMSEEEIKKLVAEAINNTGAKEMKDMGKVMGELMQKVKGKADNALVSKTVKNSLSK